MMDNRLPGPTYLSTNHTSRSFSVGDFVIEINHVNVQSLRLRDVLELVNGAAGDVKVKLRPSKHHLRKTEHYVKGHKTQVYFQSAAYQLVNLP